ncbi:MAG TPA: SDR family oxidoreductase [Planctomycetes bacterium]|nr:SDR family oxidoreductase [Fuerstiella sp.]HIK92109.1 SDR family oxidoreductase [Planctomycetota bacterium]
MKILIIGGGGMIGRKLAGRLAADGKLGEREISELTLFDVVSPDAPGDSAFPVKLRTGDLSNVDEAKALVAEQPDVIFHLAAIVSGEAEEDFAKGYRINLDGTRHLLDAVCAINEYVPRVVFTSSIAVFGAPFPDAITDDFHTTPLTSYGTQKAIGELLLSDFTRRGMMDGIGIRLPTICVRPGSPNKAASGFFSNIIREPLAGAEAVLPVSDDVQHWHASPRSAVGFLLHAATIDGTIVGNRRNLTMPGIAVTVGEQIEALRTVAGDNVASRIRRVPDEKIMHMVSGWPRNFRADRATGLGFQADASFEQIIRAHVNDELGGNIG